MGNTNQVGYHVSSTAASTAESASGSRPAGAATSSASLKASSVRERRLAAAKEVARASSQFGAFWVDARPFKHKKNEQIGGSAGSTSTAAGDHSRGGASTGELRQPGESFSYDRDLVLQAVDDLFGVSDQEKKLHAAIPGLGTGSIPRGYIEHGARESLGGSPRKAPFEHREGFVFGYSGWEKTSGRGSVGERSATSQPEGYNSQPHPDHDMEGYNSWPQVPIFFLRIIRVVARCISPSCHTIGRLRKN